MTAALWLSCDFDTVVKNASTMSILLPSWLEARVFVYFISGVWCVMGRGAY